MGECDAAAENESQYLERAIYKARAGTRDSRVEAVFCQDCGERIPQKRKAAIPWCTRCVTCQAIHELADGVR